MYLDYFSLKRHPFRITPDPSLFFPGGAHGRGVVLDALVYAITTGEGILKVVGEVGSGKTMLCRMLEERLPASVEIVYLANPNLSARDIIYAIAFELKLEVEANTDRLVVMHKLQDYLLQRHSVGANVVVFIEEAQSMPLETLEEVRLLSNLETHRHKLMQIVLFGQPELDRKLQDKSIRQLRERITHSFNLEPLTADEVREYLHFRLQTAGCPWPQLFDPRSEKMLAKASEGLTRRINILADKALLASYADPAVRQEPRSSSGEILPMVLPRHVKTAIADSAYSSRHLEKYLPYSGYAVAVVALAGLIFVLFKYVWVTNSNGLIALTTTVVPQVESEQTPADLQTKPVPVTATIPTGADLQVAVEERLPAAPAENAPITAQQDTAIGVAEPRRIEIQNSTSTPVIENASAEIATPPAPAITHDVTGSTQSISARQDEPGPDVNGAVALQDSLGANPTQSDPHDLPIDLPIKEERGDSRAPDNMPAVSPQKSPFTFAGLAAIRAQPSADWLAGLPSKIGYTIQIFSALTREPGRLDQFLARLESNMMLDQTFLCVISGNDTRPEQWLVLYSEFSRLSEAQKLIESFPSDISQYAPYTRNLNDIECAN